MERYPGASIQTNNYIRLNRVSNGEFLFSHVPCSC
uniref:Uncharacterized protein n=1 Tax=Rhizophora mucronata TaxID=61149 RepID=A0A2P2MYI7_RHIMU